MIRATLLGFILITVGAVIGRAIGQQITPVTDPGGYVVGLHWDPQKNVLYYADVPAGTAYMYDPSNRRTNHVSLGGLISTIIPIRSQEDTFLISRNLSVYEIGWDGESTSASSEMFLFSVVDVDLTGNQFNPGKADINGALFIGTIGNISIGPDGLVDTERNLAALYRYKAVSNVCTVDTLIKYSSSSSVIAWDPLNEHMYYSDGVTGIINVYDYNPETAEFSKGKVFFDLAQNGYSSTNGRFLVGVAGISVDSSGSLWTTVYGKGQVIEISSQGSLLRTLNLPVLLVSDIVWGGPDFSTLYVSSVSNLLNDEELQDQPSAGAVFAIVDLGTQGVAGRSYDVVVCTN